MAHDPDRRDAFERAAADLVGERLLGVRYSDVHLFDSQARAWDYKDWHHAVMGVELLTDAGPVALVWTNTFYPYGVELFRQPLTEHLRNGPEGPDVWEVSDHPMWQDRIGERITQTTFWWEPVSVGPGVRVSGGEQIGDPDEFEVPVALRLDFFSDAGPIWFVAAIPDTNEPDKTFIGGDEIMVVFDSAKLTRMGFPADAFLSPSRDAQNEER